MWEFGAQLKNSWVKSTTCILPKMLEILPKRREIDLDNFGWSSELKIVYVRWDWLATKIIIHFLRNIHKRRKFSIVFCVNKALT